MENCLILEIPPFLLVNFLKAFVLKGKPSVIWKIQLFSTLYSKVVPPNELLCILKSYGPLLQQ